MYIDLHGFPGIFKISQLKMLQTTKQVQKTGSRKLIFSKQAFNPAPPSQKKVFQGFPESG